jgi:hypothetical protein
MAKGKTPFLENARKRHKRYEVAKSRMDQWLGLLEDAYKYAIPDRDDFFDKSEAENRMDDIFDSTAIEGVQNFANNIQIILTPPFSRWATLIPGDLVSKSKGFTDQEKKSIKEKLEEVTEILFKHLQASNFSLKSNESLQDLSVGTGIMILNEGSDDDPFQFGAVPISQVAIGEGGNGSIENFWRAWNIEIRLVEEKWPGIKLTPDLESLAKNAPDQKVKVLEGSIHYPQNDSEHEYCYYVQSMKGGFEDMLFEWRDYNAFTGFRAALSPGEILGRGPVLRVLPDIKVINKMKEMTLKGAAMRAFPVTLVENDAVINPDKFDLEAGDIIPIEPSVSGKDPIRPMQVGGDVNFAQLMIKDLTETIKDALFADPLGDPEETSQQTATQTEIRQSNWIKKNAATFSRLTDEWLNEILNKCIIILRKKNIINDIVINGKTVELKLKDKSIAIQYASPLLSIQDQADAQKTQTYLQWLVDTFGETALSTTPKVADTQIWMAEKMGVPSKLINDEITINKKMVNLAKQAALAAQVQAGQGTSPVPGGAEPEPEAANLPSPLGANSPQGGQ